MAQLGPQFRWLAAAVTLLALPLVARAGFKCPAEGGPPWRELTTPHFVVWTPLDAEAARETAARLEQLRAAVARGIRRDGVETQGRLEAVALPEWELTDFVGRGSVRTDGWFQRSAFGSRIVADAEADRRPTLAHELAHHFVAYTFARVPVWLNEGLAQFYETIELEPLDAGRVRAVIGRPLPRTRIPLPGSRRLAAHAANLPALVSTDRLFAWGSRPIDYGPETLDLYATAWAAVHYLANRHPQRFSQFLGRLARAESPDAAFRAVFPEFDPAGEKGRSFEKELENYVDGTRYSFITVEVAPDVTISERLMTDAEVHALRASMFAHLPSGAVADAPQRAKAELEASLRAAPDNAAALWVAPDGVKRAGAAAASSPKDWRAWVLLARSLPDTEASWTERLAALEKAAALAPENAGVLNELAWALLQHGESGSALPIARRAAQIAPWDASILDTLGAVVADLGQCAAAIAVQERAAELLPEGGNPEAVKEVRQRLADIRAQCGGGPAGGSSAGAR